ncbi:MAG: hypothetical protein HY800_03745 [Ignavibacteriales bacterium]|nr:hypothetical protein [Ignavibacteriales bacterium]
MSECPLCNNAANLYNTKDYERIKYYKCERCGNYSITDDILHFIQSKYSKKNHIISGYIRWQNEGRKSPVILSTGLIDEIFSSYPYPKTVTEKVERLLIDLANQSKRPGQIIQINLEHSYPLIFAEDYRELDSLFDYLVSRNELEIRPKPIKHSSQCGLANPTELRA